MGQQLRGRDMLQREGVVRRIGEDGITRRIVMDRRREGVLAREHALAKGDAVGRRIEVGDARLAEIGGEYEAVVRAGTAATSLAGCTAALAAPLDDRCMAL